jgi:hypothetical protein
VRIVKKLRPVVARAKRRYYTWQLSQISRQQVAALPPTTRPGLDEATRAEALQFVDGLVRGYRDLRWHDAYAQSNGRPSAHYMPEDIFYALAMPVLNPKDRSGILSDKNHFDLMEGWPSLPPTVGRLMNGRLLDPHFRPATPAELVRQLPPGSQLVVKPSRVTGSGKAVAFVEAGSLGDALVGRTDAIIQLPVQQHREIAVLNSSSLNSLRINTYRKLDGEVVHLGTFMRMGRSGSHVDNTGAGGLFCGIDDKRGVLNADGFSKNGLKVYQAHPDNGLLFADRKVPGFAAARDAYIAAHRQLPWIDLASWDVAIDTAGQPVTIEINVGTTISTPQIASGPIFAPVMDDLRQRIGRRRYSRLAGFL